MATNNDSTPAIATTQNIVGAPQKLQISIFSAFIFVAVILGTQWAAQKYTSNGAPWMTFNYNQKYWIFLTIQTAIFFGIVYLTMKPWEKAS